ncbi:hypothetical protein DesLBE_1348 [Desulfitobacterium sp. LBE]|uniref:Prokaryotic membrane lipoprotein lipid attachment site profile n=2 Tax=root TaxID=1 RepID=A0A098B3Z8_DESHA|nr:MULTISPECIES: hypothetical protein [Desulfitobacterium]MEA5022944.1 hypothetical protein [Desulfitobacterium hafniense]TWH57088.1 hypothetical protein DesLBE_1348 [Desulfitobacterium sp. LBE]CDX03569.1 Prokaryotic membrane lipoprotein lipid attachment site profile [Desulfitobacterium hafniense]
MMKKVLFLLIAVAIFFCGCSSSSSQNSRDGISANPDETVSGPAVITGREVISWLDTRLNKNGYPTLEMGVHSELTHAFASASYQCDLYIPSRGMYLYFISDPEDNRLHQLIFYTNHDEISAPAEELQSYILSSLPFFFEPDRWEELSNQLAIGVSSGKGQSLAANGAFEYFHENNEAFTAFNVCATGEELIDMQALDFANGEITSQKIDWTIADFVAKLDEYAMKKEMPLLSDTRPVSVGAEDLEGLSPDICEGVYYSLGPGVRMYLFASDAGRLERVEFIALLNSVTSDSLSRFGYTLTIAVNALDDARASDILDTIKIDNISREENRPAIGGRMNYFYSVTNESLGLYISRNSPMVSVSKNQEPANNIEEGSQSKIETRVEANNLVPSDSPAKPPETVKKSGNPYTEGSPRFEGWLCEKLDVRSDSTTVKPVNPKTSFKSGETLYLAGRYYGWAGEENLTLIWEWPDGTTSENERYYFVAGNQESWGCSQSCNPGPGSLTIIMDSTGQTLATFEFTITD